MVYSDWAILLPGQRVVATSPLYSQAMNACRVWKRNKLDGVCLLLPVNSCLLLKINPYNAVLNHGQVIWLCACVSTGQTVFSQSSPVFLLITWSPVNKKTGRLWCFFCCFQDASFKDLDHLTKTDTPTVYHLHEQNVLSRFGQIMMPCLEK